MFPMYNQNLLPYKLLHGLDRLKRIKFVVSLIILQEFEHWVCAGDIVLKFLVDSQCIFNILLVNCWSWLRCEKCRPALDDQHPLYEVVLNASCAGEPLRLVVHISPFRFWPRHKGCRSDAVPGVHICGIVVGFGVDGRHLR